MDKRTILIVDDELKIRILLKDFLESSGFNIIEAENGKIALDIFKKFGTTINLILLDIILILDVIVVIV